MSTAVWERRLDVEALAQRSLTAAGRLWLLTAVLGQLLFAFAVGSFYGGAALRGTPRAWNRFMPHAFVAGEPLGNLVAAGHLLMAVLVTLGGAVQLVPRIRERAPAVHRWNGRAYVAFAFAVSLAGLYLLVVRGTAGDASQHLGVGLNAVVIMACAATALRRALARDFASHRRWALRLFLAMSGVWFARVGLGLMLVLFREPVGFDPKTFQGPFLTFLAFAAYLLPLAVLELYLRVQERAGAAGRFALAAGLVVLTLATGAGILGAGLASWLPKVKAAYDSRPSVATALSETITTGGVEAAVKRYRALRAAAPAAYNFDEGELNALGYELLRERRLAAAIRIFELNVEAYPRSSNTWDSLAEAYLDGGDRPQAVAHYRKALELDPHNRNAAETLRQLGAP